MAGGGERRHVGRGHVRNVRLAALNRRHFPRVEIDADGGQPAAAELDGQGKSDISEADDAGARAP